MCIYREPNLEPDCCLRSLFGFTFSQRLLTGKSIHFIGKNKRVFLAATVADFRNFHFVGISQFLRLLLLIPFRGISMPLGLNHDHRRSSVNHRITTEVLSRKVLLRKPSLNAPLGQTFAAGYLVVRST